MTEKKNSYLAPALILICAVAALITMVGVIKCNVAVSLMIVGIITIFLAQATGAKWETISVNIGEAINTVYIGVFIMMLVGMLIGSWMAAGTVPMLMYYGLKWLSPSIFLVATCILCSLMSIMRHFLGYDRYNGHCFDWRCQGPWRKRDVYDRRCCDRRSDW